MVAQFETEDEVRLSFVIVFGSQARGDAGDESDLDIYAEANIPRPRGFSIPGYDVMINPNGTLMGGANLGFEMSNDVIRDACVWHDDGSFRSLVIWLDEQGAGNENANSTGQNAAGDCEPAVAACGRSSSPTTGTAWNRGAGLDRCACRRLRLPAPPKQESESAAASRSA